MELVAASLISIVLVAVAYIQDDAEERRHKEQIMWLERVAKASGWKEIPPPPMTLPDPKRSRSDA